MLLAKNKLNTIDTIQILISEGIIDSYINYDKFILVNNVLPENNEMKKEIKNIKRGLEYNI